MAGCSQWLRNRTPFAIVCCLLILISQSKNRAIIVRFPDNLQAERKALDVKTARNADGWQAVVIGKQGVLG